MNLEKLNGAAPLVEAVGLELADIRRDWRVEASEMRTKLLEGLLELERLAALTRERLANLKDGAPGRDGVNGKDGAPGLPGERGEPGPAGGFEVPANFKAGQITYAGKLIYHEGSTFYALRDTAATPPHADFQPIAHRGRDAYAGRAHGLFDEKAEYRAMDVVTLNGSEWRAVKDNPGPCPGDGWMLGAKGTKGKPGDRGEKGERGDPGIGFVHVERAGNSLVFTRSDGSAQSFGLVFL
jgi:integrin beta 3